MTGDMDTPDTSAMNLLILMEDRHRYDAMGCAAAAFLPIRG